MINTVKFLMILILPEKHCPARLQNFIRNRRNLVAKFLFLLHFNTLFGWFFGKKSNFYKILLDGLFCPLIFCKELLSLYNFLFRKLQNKPALIAFQDLEPKFLDSGYLSSPQFNTDPLNSTHQFNTRATPFQPLKLVN